MLWYIFTFINVLSFSVTSSLDLSSIAAGNRMGSAPLGRSLGDGELDVEGVCEKPGVTCQNCTHAVICVALPVGWLKFPLIECADEETCNARQGGCSKQPVPECDVPSLKFQHICEQVGIFPDAYDCRKFHLCSPPTDFPQGRPADIRSALCPRHYAYNPYTAQCSIRLLHGQCDQKPVPECTTIGQSDGLPGSPNHYYICLSKHGALYPQIFLCPNGWFFWDGFCRPEAQPQKALTSTEEVPTTKKAVLSEAPVKEMDAKLYPALSFFSTEKSTTYAQDTFLADKFDLSNFETADSSGESFSYDTNNSFENSFETGFGTID